MEIKVIDLAARSVTLELADGGIYYTKEPYQIELNGVPVKQADMVITSLFDLKPETTYELMVKKADGSVLGTLEFCTGYEFVTLNVKDFGAKGDGVQDDTKFIQAAILSCPKDSRVLVPEGTYCITSLFLKSDLNLELAKGAELKAKTERSEFQNSRL